MRANALDGSRVGGRQIETALHQVTRAAPSAGIDLPVPQLCELVHTTLAQLRATLMLHVQR